MASRIKALHPLLMLGDISSQNLERNLAIQLHIRRQLRLTNAACADLRADFAPAKSCARLPRSSLQLRSPIDYQRERS